MANQRTVIAIVDDNFAVGTALARLLSVLGYHTELFGSAGEFLNVAATSKADCLLVDVQLGKVSGLDLVSQLSAAGFKFRVIFMTGSDSDVLRKRAKSVGCSAYLLKPFPIAQLVKAITDAM